MLKNKKTFRRPKEPSAAVGAISSVDGSYFINTAFMREIFL